jgi:hypothetical protein
MNIVNLLSVGTVYQNFAFYSFLILLGCLNFELARHGKELKKFRGIPNNR